MNGDLITDLNFGEFVESSRASGCDLTVAYAKYTYRSPTAFCPSPMEPFRE